MSSCGTAAIQVSTATVANNGGYTNNPFVAGDIVHIHDGSTTNKTAVNVVAAAGGFTAAVYTNLQYVLIDNTTLSLSVGSKVIESTPVWGGLKQVHGKGTKRWPKGTKGNLVQLVIDSTNIGQTKLSRVNTYYKTLPRSI